jgi:hypothetical protein
MTYLQLTSSIPTIHTIPLCYLYTLIRYKENFHTKSLTITPGLKFSSAIGLSNMYQIGPGIAFLFFFFFLSIPGCYWYWVLSKNFDIDLVLVLGPKTDFWLV